MKFATSRHIELLRSSHHLLSIYYKHETPNGVPDWRIPSVQTPATSWQLVGQERQEVTSPGRSWQARSRSSACLQTIQFNLA
jgi:hypothetical protein